MTKQHPLAWVRQISESVAKLNEIPLFGHAPRLDWHRLSELLAKTFDADGLTLQAKGQKWCEDEEIQSGLGAHSLVTPVTISPLAPPIFWAMARKDIDRLTGWLLDGHPKGRSFSSDILQEGYYRFLLLETLDALQGMAPLQQMTLHLGDDSSVPKERSFCVDVEISFGGQVCWGRLILPNGFRKAWAHHFSAFPSEFAPSELSRKLELMVGVKIGAVSLGIEEWNLMEPGDLLLLDQCNYDAKLEKGKGSLILGKTVLFKTKISKNKAELVEYAFTNEDAMQNEHPEESVAIKDLPLCVTVELARLKVTLDHLMNMTPGNTLELPVHPEQGVSLTVGGQKVGTGELVYLGESLGVRILSIG